MVTLAQTDASGLSALLDTLGRNLPRVAVFVLILVVGYLVAKAAQRTVDRVLARVGFDRAVERGGIGRVLARTRYDPSRVLGRLVFYALLLFVLQAAFGVFGPNPVSDLIRGVLAYLPNLFVAIILVVVAAAVATAVAEIIEAALGDLPSARPIALIASGAILVIGVFAALDQLNVAPDVVNILFIAVVAAVTGSIIVGVGGSLILPLRVYWERAFSQLEREAPRMRAQTAGTSSRLRARAERRAAEARAVQRRARRPEQAPERSAPSRPAPEQPDAPPRRPPTPPQRPPAPPQRPIEVPRPAPERPVSPPRPAPERPASPPRLVPERSEAPPWPVPERSEAPPRPVPERYEAPTEALPADFDLPRPREREDTARRSPRNIWGHEGERPDPTQRLSPLGDRPRPRRERPPERPEQASDEADLTQPLRPVRPDDEPNGRRR